MVTYSIIQKSQLEGGLRLDAEYYQPEYLQLDEKIKKFPNHLLKDFAVSCSSGKNLSQVQCRNNESKFFIRTQNVRPVLINKGGITCLEPSIKKFPILKDGDVLAVRVGEGVGNTSIVTEEFSGHTYSDNVLRVRVKSVDPYFLIIFLNSKFGYSYWERIGKGSARSLVSSENLYRIRIPDLGKEISEFCRNAIYEATKETRRSEFFCSQAENLLLEELGLKNFEIDDDLSYIVNLSEIKSAHRADAEYFQPKYDKLVEKIKKYCAAPLLNLVQNVAARFNSKSQPTKLFQYVELSNITSSIGTIDGFSEVSGDEAPSRAKRVLKTNDVVLSSVEGSLEKVALVGKEQEGYLASNGFFQFRSKDILPEVLLVLAKSFVLQMQFEKQTAGTILTAVPKEAVKNIVIPRINRSIQQKIAAFVQKSHEARSKAKQLLEQAKGKVENLIEK